MFGYTQQKPQKVQKKEITLPALSDSGSGEEHLTTLQYCENTRQHEIKMTRRDYQKLEPGEYLNDTLIMFWLKFYQHFCYPHPEEVHIFDTHFYSKMVAETDSLDGLKLQYDCVKRWTRKKNLFAKKFLVFPICVEEHWSVVVVGNVDKIVSQT